MNIKQLLNNLLDYAGMAMGLFFIIIAGWGLGNTPYYVLWWIIGIIGVGAFIIHYFRYFGFGPVRKLFGL